VNPAANPVADVSLDWLASADAAAALHEVRSVGPVAWVPALGGWLVTGRDESVAVLRDADVFTVDDDRFSTAVVVGTSMLSTDGDEHARHRAPFTAPFTGTAVTRNYAARVAELANTRVADMALRGSGDLRTELAGPLAVAVIVDVLGLDPAQEAEVLGWYRSIVHGVTCVSAGAAIASATTASLTALREAIDLAAQQHGSMLWAAAQELDNDALFSNTAVLMFGAIETSEGMTANALWHLLTVPGLARRVRGDRPLVAPLIEESLRLEPAAAVVDRYATRSTTLGGAEIAAGDFVRVSLTGANRDPAFFEEPDRFDVGRSNARQHLAFVQGPHVCLGLHLARAQTAAAMEAVLDQLHELSLHDSTVAPTGLIFRKPERVMARWELPERDKRSKAVRSDPATKGDLPMSQQHIDVWKQSASAFDQRWQAVQQDQWQAQSNCDGWNVQELCDHAIGAQVAFAGPVVGAEIAQGASWPEVNAAISSALEQPGVLEGMIDHPAMGTVPKAMIFGIAATDMLIHSWDLARSIGADEQLPAEAVSACYSGLQMMPDEMRFADGRFKPGTECADDADEQTKMIAFSGRQV